MTIGKVLKAWFITVVVGSILAQILYIPLILMIKEKGWDFITGFFFSWTYVTLIMSTVLSIPSILILIAVNHKLKEQKASLNKLDKLLTLTQLAYGLVTFLILIMGFSFDAWEYLIVTAIAFITTGIIIWKKEIKKLAPTKPISNSALRDATAHN